MLWIYFLVAVYGLFEVSGDVYCGVEISFIATGMLVAFFLRHEGLER
jgi:hypothetical protein